jgi:hypothetical protein
MWERITHLNFKSPALLIVVGTGLIFILLVNNTYAIIPNKIHVNITSPSEGQRVPVDSSITMFGTSTDNATTDCTLYAGWNSSMPYQKVLAVGPAGINDFSTWIFSYTKNYHLITEGMNTLTAKISCYANPVNLTKYDSVNVTGVLVDKDKNRDQGQSEIPANYSILDGNNIKYSRNPTEQVPGDNSSTIPFWFPPFFSGNPNSSNDYNNESNTIPAAAIPSESEKKSLVISIVVAKNPVVWGNEQMITVKVSDASSNEKINGAIIRGTIASNTTASTTIIKEFTMVTDSSGRLSYPWLITGNIKHGTFAIAIQASALGFNSSSGKASFEVIPPVANNMTVSTVERTDKNTSPSTTSLS